MRVGVGKIVFSFSPHSLEAPCQTLAAAEPKDIPTILPKVLHCIRLIFNVSRFYNTPERITGVLRKVSNEIIMRCSSKISLAQVFDGGVEKCMQGLHESIHAGEEWKRIYSKTAAAINARPSKVQQTVTSAIDPNPRGSRRG